MTNTISTFRTLSLLSLENGKTDDWIATTCRPCSDLRSKGILLCHNHYKTTLLLTLNIWIYKLTVSCVEVGNLEWRFDDSKIFTDILGTGAPLTQTRNWSSLDTDSELELTWHRLRTRVPLIKSSLDTDSELELPWHTLGTRAPLTKSSLDTDSELELPYLTHTRNWGASFREEAYRTFISSWRWITTYDCKNRSPSHRRCGMI